MQSTIAAASQNWNVSIIGLSLQKTLVDIIRLMVFKETSYLAKDTSNRKLNFWKIGQDTSREKKTILATSHIL